MGKVVRITHAPTGPVIAEGPLGWGVTPFEGNYYIRKKHLKTDRFRRTFAIGFCPNQRQPNLALEPDVVASHVRILEGPGHPGSCSDLTPRSPVPTGTTNAGGSVRAAAG